MSGRIACLRACFGNRTPMLLDTRDSTRYTRVRTDRPVCPYPGSFVKGLRVSLKEQIIHQSMRLFSLHGFLNTSMRDILEAANTSKGGFYNHFKSKEDLLFAVLGEARRLWRERSLAGLDQTASTVEKIRKFLTNYRDNYLGDRDSIPGGCIFVALAMELADQKPHLAREVSEGMSGLKRMILRLLKEGIASGEIRENVSAQAAAELIFSGLLGASLIYSVDKSIENLDRSIGILIDYLDGLSPLNPSARTQGTGPPKHERRK